MGQSGQTDLITGLVYILITISVVGVVLSVGLPYIDKTREISEIRENEKLMKEIDKIISTVASEGEGASRFLTVDIKNGKLDINGERDSISITTETTAEVIAKRHRISRGNFYTGSDLEVDLQSAVYLDENVWALENSRLYLAIRKFDRNTGIKLDRLVKGITFKPTGQKYMGRVNMYLDNYTGNDANVITVAKETGLDLARGEIIAVVSATNYDANIHFVLESGNDFVKVYADGTRWK